MEDLRGNVEAGASAAEEAFEEAFLQLYAKTPLRRISVTQVAERAGYTRGTFYLHYESLEDLLRRIEDGLLEELRAVVDDSMARLEAGGDPEEVMADVLAFYEGRADRLRVLMGPKADSHFTDEVKRTLKPIWAKYVLKRDVNEGSTDFMLEFTLSGALVMLRRWMENPKGVSAEEMLHIIYHKVLGK